MSASVCVLCTVLGPWIHVLAVPGRRRPGRDGRSLVNPKRPLRRPNFPNRLASSRTCHAMRCHDPTSNSVWFNREDTDLAGSWLGERVPSMVRSQAVAPQHAASCSSSLQSRHPDREASPCQAKPTDFHGPSPGRGPERSPLCSGDDTLSGHLSVSCLMCAFRGPATKRERRH